MGGQISVTTKLGENELFRKFAGLQPISDNDPFWNQLLCFNWRVNETVRAERLQFDAIVADLLQALM
jgi:hypothetical protein